MAIGGNQLLVGGSGGGGDIEPIGVPTGVSLVGSRSFIRNTIPFFGYDGLSVYYQDTFSVPNFRTRWIQYQMTTPYDITTLSTSGVFGGAFATGSGAIGDIIFTFNGLQIMGRDNTYIRARGTDGAVAWVPNGGGTFYGSWPMFGQCHYAVQGGEYLIFFGNNALLKVQLNTPNDLSTYGASPQTTYNLSAYQSAGASSSISFNGASINGGQHLLHWDSLNSQIKIFQNNAAFDFTSPTLVSTFSIPTSDPEIVGTEANIEISYQGGYLYAQKIGSYKIFQFAFTY